MSGLKRWRPSPATALASIALFVSLGGVSYGVATGSIDSRELKNNTVRSKDIRNNQVTGRDIRRGGVFGSDVHNSSLTGTDVKNDSLTGRDVLESSLGKVPNATAADVAGSAGSFGGFQAVHVGASPLVLTNGQTKDLLSTAGLTFTAACTINGDPDGGGPDPVGDYARINIATTQDHAAFDGDDNDGDLLVADPLDGRQFVEAANTGGAIGSPTLDQETDGTALAANGTEVYSPGLYGAVNILNRPGECRFGGYFGVG
jgi:hypothetical protein